MMFYNDYDEVKRTSKRIVIDLDNSTYAKALSESEIIHVYEYHALCRYIDERIDVRKKDKYESELPNETITVLGSRGSGKTTFLQTIIRKYENISDVCILGLIDPTMIEDKGHIFLTILSIINRKVKEYLKTQYSVCNSNYAYYHKRWEEKLKSLASGLPSVEGVGYSYDSWQDPTFIMERGLDAVDAAYNLRKMFYELTDLALEILDKKIFLLVLDDIDVDFRKGWMVLETIRKYLTKSNIITIISGDYNLFSKSVRKVQWKNIGKALIKNDCEKLNMMQAYNRVVTDIEEQYLRKILKPANRLFLNTILQNMNDFSIMLKTSEGNEISIKKYYSTFISRLGIRNKSQLTLYLNFILGLPLRTQIQLLKRLDTNLTPTAILDTFASHLYSYQINVEQLQTNKWFIMPEVLRFLITSKFLNDAFKLQPVMLEQSFNQCLFPLGVLVCIKIKDTPALVFDYFVRIGYMKNLGDLIEYSDEYSLALHPSFESLCDQSAIFEDKGLNDIACKISSYTLACLRQLATKRFNYAPYGILEVLDRPASGLMSLLWDIPTLSVEIGRRRNFFSFPVLLGSIEELLRCYEESPSDIEKCILQLAQVKIYQLPKFTNDTGPVIDEQIKFIGLDIQEDETLKILTQFAEIFKKWAESYPKQKVSPHLLGSMSSRAFKAFKNLDSPAIIRRMPENRYLTHVEGIKMFIIAFMNAVLVEDFNEFIPNILLSTNNPKTSDTQFYLNIIKATQLNHKLYDLLISRWILACPLLLIFKGKSQNDDHLYNYIKEYISREDFDFLMSNSLNNNKY